MHCVIKKKFNEWSETYEISYTVRRPLYKTDLRIRHFTQNKWYTLEPPLYTTPAHPRFLLYKNRVQ